MHLHKSKELKNKKIIEMDISLYFDIQYFADCPVGIFTLSVYSSINLRLSGQLRAKCRLEKVADKQRVITSDTHENCTTFRLLTKMLIEENVG